MILKVVGIMNIRNNILRGFALGLGFLISAPTVYSGVPLNLDEITSKGVPVEGVVERRAAAPKQLGHLPCVSALGAASGANGSQIPPPAWMDQFEWNINAQELRVWTGLEKKLEARLAKKGEGNGALKLDEDSLRSIKIQYFASYSFRNLVFSSIRGFGTPGGFLGKVRGDLVKVMLSPDSDLIQSDAVSLFKENSLELANIGLADIHYLNSMTLFFPDPILDSELEAFQAGLVLFSSFWPQEPRESVDSNKKSVFADYFFTAQLYVYSLLKTFPDELFLLSKYIKEKSHPTERQRLKKILRGLSASELKYFTEQFLASGGEVDSEKWPVDKKQKAYSRLKGSHEWDEAAAHMALGLEKFLAQWDRQALVSETGDTRNGAEEIVASGGSQNARLLCERKVNGFIGGIYSWCTDDSNGSMKTVLWDFLFPPQVETRRAIQLFNVTLDNTIQGLNYRLRSSSVDINTNHPFIYIHHSER